MESSNQINREPSRSRDSLINTMQHAAHLAQDNEGNKHPIVSLLIDALPGHLPEQNITPRMFASAIREIFDSVRVEITKSQPEQLDTLDILNTTALYFIKSALNNRVWSEPLEKLQPDTTEVEGIPFASARIIDIRDKEVASAYLRQVDGMARWIVAELRRAGIDVSDDVLSKTPAFSYGQIKATGAIGVIFEQSKIEIWTPFGMFDASGWFDDIPESVSLAIKEKFQLRQVSSTSTAPGMVTRGIKGMFVATIDAEGNQLSPAFQRDPDGDILKDVWDIARPETRCAVGEEHCLPPADREQMKEYHLKLTQNNLLSEDQEVRLEAFYELARAPEFLPTLIDSFSKEGDLKTKGEMFDALVKYKSKLMTYPEFGKAVSDWLSGMLTKESMASPDNLRKVYYTIGELRSVGPIAPDKMIPILIHTLDLYASPQWPLSLLAMYGKAAEPARERVEQLIDSDDYWVKNNAIEVISRLQ